MLIFVSFTRVVILTKDGKSVRNSLNYQHVVHNFESCSKQHVTIIIDNIHTHTYLRTFIVLFSKPPSTIQSIREIAQGKTSICNAALGNRGILDLPFKSRKDGGKKACVFLCLRLLRSRLNERVHASLSSRAQHTGRVSLFAEGRWDSIMCKFIAGALMRM